MRSAPSKKVFIVIGSLGIFVVLALIAVSNFANRDTEAEMPSVPAIADEEAETPSAPARQTEGEAAVLPPKQGVLEAMDDDAEPEKDPDSDETRPSPESDLGPALSPASPELALTPESDLEPEFPPAPPEAVLPPESAPEPELPPASPELALSPGAEPEPELAPAPPELSLTPESDLEPESPSASPELALSPESAPEPELPPALPELAMPPESAPEPELPPAPPELALSPETDPEPELPPASPELALPPESDLEPELPPASPELSLAPESAPEPELPPAPPELALPPESAPEPELPPAPPELALPPESAPEPELPPASPELALPPESAPGPELPPASPELALSPGAEPEPELAPAPPELSLTPESDLEPESPSASPELSLTPESAIEPELPPAPPELVLSPESDLEPALPPASPELALPPESAPEPELPPALPELALPPESAPEPELPPASPELALSPESDLEPESPSALPEAVLSPESDLEPELPPASPELSLTPESAIEPELPPAPPELVLSPESDLEPALPPALPELVLPPESAIEPELPPAPPELALSPESDLEPALPPASPELVLSPETDPEPALPPASPELTLPPESAIEPELPPAPPELALSPETDPEPALPPALPELALPSESAIEPELPPAPPELALSPESDLEPDAPFDPSPETTTPPPAGALVIRSPWNNEYYSSVVTVTGEAPGFTELAWRSEAIDLDGAIPLMEDGSFSFSVATYGHSEDLDIVVFGIDDAAEPQEVRLRLVNDGIGPSLDLVSPLAGDYFMDEIEIAGQVGAGPHEPEGIGEIESLSWSLNGEDFRPVIFGPEGDFSFRLGMWDYSDRVELTVIVVDLNDNETRKVIPLIDGRMPPELTITHPADQSEYGAGVFLKGRVSDPYGDAGDFGGIRSIRYEILASDAATRDGLVTGDVSVTPDGSFDIPVLTTDLVGKQEISIIVTGENGRETIQTLGLRQGQSPIPDFTVQSDNEAANAVWGAVPTATEYHLTVYDTAGGPVRHILSDNSAVLAGLNNGTEYRFKVEAFMPTGQVESHFVRTIPLSEETLRPNVTGEFRRIRVNWTEISGSDTYAIYRAESEEGPFTLTATGVPGDEYLDTDVNFGQRYWYALAPTAYAERMSAPEPAESLSAQELSIEQLSRLDSISPESIHIAGAYAFVASRDSGLVLVDIAEPARPAEVSRTEIPGAEDVAVQESYAYVVAGNSGLRVVNIDDPSNTILMGSERAGNAVAVDVEGEYAFIADRNRGLRVLDVSNAREPLRIAATDGLDGRDVLVSGNIAYLAAGSNGIRIYDVSLPTAPNPLASITVDGAEKIILEETLLIAGGLESGVHIYDVADPTEPKLLSHIADVEVSQLESSQEFLLATTPEELILVDIRLPEDPFVFRSYPLPDSDAMAMFGDSLLLSENRGLSLYQTYLIGSSFVTRELETEGRSYGVRNVDGKLYVSSHSGGLSVINPQTLTTEEHYKTEFAKASARDSDLIYVADGLAGVRVIRPVLGRDIVFEGNGFVYDVVVLDGIAYAASESGLVVISGTGGVVRSLGTVDMPKARTVATDGSLIFVGGENTLHLFVPVAGALPLESSTASVPGIRDVAVSEGLVATVGESGVSLLRYNAQGRLSIVGEIPASNAESVTLDDRYLYLSAGYRGLLIYDIRQYESPKLVSTGTEAFALDAVVIGNTAFVVDGEGLKEVSLFIPVWFR